MGAIDESKLNSILPKYSELKLSGKNLAQQYVSAFNTGMNIYQCINQLQGYIEWVIKAVNDVVVQWNEIVDKQIKYAINESITASKQATTEQFNKEWTTKQPELIEQVNTLTTNQFNNEKSIFNDELNALNARMDTFAKFSKPNLLINPDFKINQRGSTSYKQQGYSVDRWKIWNVTVTPNANGGITVKNDEYSDTGTFTQILENATEGESTLSCYVESVSGTVTMVADDNTQVILKQGLNVVHTSNSTKNFIIFLNQGTSITLKWVKLEQGSIVTPFVAPNPAEELTKCYRFKYIGKAVLRARCTETQIFGFTKDLPTKLRTKPTTTFKSKNSYNVNTVDVTISEENNAVYLAGTADNTNQTVIDVVLDLDAEIY